MVSMSIVKCHLYLLHKLLKKVGMEAKQVEIEPGTVMNFWVPIIITTPPSKNNPLKKKPPLVFLHGFAGDGILTWQFQILSSALRKKYSFYVPDLLFFGGSHTIRTERTPRFQADCLANGLRRLGVEEKCIVVGFSYGGSVGFQMAQHHPDLVRSLVVSGSVLDLTESISSRALESIGFSSWSEFLVPNSVEGLKVMLDIGSYKFPWFPTCFFKQYFEAMFINRKEKIELLESLVVKDEDVTDHQFEQMIYLLWGNEDRVFSMEVANDLKEQLGAKAELKTLEKAGHVALLERPFAYNTCLKELLASLEA